MATETRRVISAVDARTSIAAIMTPTDRRLSSASAVAGNVWSLAAGRLMHGLLRSHRCDRSQVSLAMRGVHFFTGLRRTH